MHFPQWIKQIFNNQTKQCHGLWTKLHTSARCQTKLIWITSCSDRYEPAVSTTLDLNIFHWPGRNFHPPGSNNFFYLHFSGTMHTTIHACPVTMATRDARPSPKRRQALSRSRALRRAWCRFGEWVWHDTFYWLSRSNRNTRRWNCSSSVLFFVSVPRMCTW